VPDFCVIDIDRRLIPGESPAAALAGLHEALAGCEYTCDPVFACPPLTPVPDDHPLLGRLGAAIDAVAGRHERHAVAYGTDASTLSEAGIPSVVFGPGDIAQAHTHDEWIDLRQVEQAADILYRFAAG
jgi:acetylornithine deacetylase/succinyl-diaminopimelate desuccinylase-like protein